MSRDELIVALKQRNIGSGVHFTPVHLHSYYRNLFGSPLHLPIAERIGEQTISIPLSSKLTESDAQDVIAAIRDTIAQAHT